MKPIGADAAQRTLIRNRRFLSPHVNEGREFRWERLSARDEEARSLHEFRQNVEVARCSLATTFAW